MFDLLFKKEYSVVVFMAVMSFLLLLFNPVSLQNRKSKPNSLYHAVTLLVLGTLMYIFVYKYECKEL